MYALEFSSIAKKHLLKIESRYQKLIVKALNKLTDNPSVGIPLNGELKGYLKLRVSHFRIVYQVKKQILLVFIVDINHRKDIYR